MIGVDIDQLMLKRGSTGGHGAAQVQKDTSNEDWAKLEARKCLSQASLAIGVKPFIMDYHQLVSSTVKAIVNDGWW